jgi:hypothetical protein
MNNLRVILKTWMIAGTLDITAASVYYPLVYKFRLILLYQNIASGVFGEKAFAGGLTMAIVGLLFHYFIALGWTIFFFLIFPGIKLLHRNLLLSGMAYGIFVWLIMNLSVVPMSRVSRPSFPLGQIIISMAFLVFCIGLPISLMIGKYYSEESRKNG